MTIYNIDIDNSNAPKPTEFRFTDGQTFGVEFNALTAKEFELEVKKLALSSIPKNSYLKEIQVKDYQGIFRNVDWLFRKFGNGIKIDLKRVDYEFYYDALIKKAKGSWVLSHVSLMPRKKPELKII